MQDTTPPTPPSNPCTRCGETRRNAHADFNGPAAGIVLCDDCFWDITSCDDDAMSAALGGLPMGVQRDGR